MPRGMKRKMNKAVTKKRENLGSLDKTMAAESKPPKRSGRGGMKAREKRLEGKPM